ncbi:protein of unknown function [Algoriphagus locisalis]|uniref:TolB-like 6-blade propeller-like n=1 Tax=Algoriphagus locisalis TaxID=305507 RepID=A0A1I6YAN6_9BACT|nr:DUF4221 family protein [Algoriphagus locisalis]SFT47341.1 protein of unknown function [Algoriphagus locisalis]
MRLFTGILFLLIMGSFLFIGSCASKEEKKQGVSDQIKISLDTVMIDAGEEFLYLQDQLYASSLSKDNKYLINFSRRDNLAEKIDLDQLKLDKKIQYEREGPNGIGDYPSFTLLPNQNLLFWTYNFYKIFDQEGQLVKDLELEKIPADYLGSNDFFPVSFIQDESDPNHLVGLITQWKTHTYFIVDFDLEKGTSKKVDLPDYQKNIEYNFEILFDGSLASVYGPGIYPLHAHGKLLLSSSAFNEVLIYDLETDSLSVKKWDSPLLGYKKTYLPPETVEYNSGSMKDIVRKMDEEISYRSFVWDEENGRYFRFSDKKYFGEDLNEFGEYATIGADVFLSVFDKNFNLISEAQIPELTQSPNFHFAKDGNIWIFENIDDELAFVIVKIENL